MIMKEQMKTKTQKLPKWFNGEIYNKGEKVINPFSGESYELNNIELSMYKNKELVASGKGNAVQGSPYEAVAWLANTLGGLGIPFLAGEIILSGSLVPLEPVKAGDKMYLSLGGLGSARVDFV